MEPSAAPDTTWTVKEVVADLKTDLVRHLDKQDITLADISRKVDGKADKSDVVALATKIDSQGHRISVLEEHKVDVETGQKFRRRVWAVVGTVAGVLAIIAGALIAAYVH